MKKYFCALAAFAALCSGLFAESIKKEIDIIKAFLKISSKIYIIYG